MAVCDAKYKFISLEAGANGRRNDNDVFHNSDFGKLLEQKSLKLPLPTNLPKSAITAPYVFVGDGIFTLQENLLIPFPGEFIPDEEKVFNYRLSRARRVVENAFGVLTARFRILRRTVISCLTTAKGIILACCALHNYHLQNEEYLPEFMRRYLPPRYVDYYGKDGRVFSGRWRTEDKSLAESVLKRLSSPLPSQLQSTDGYFIRESFMEYFIQHPVPWQWNKVKRR